MESSVTRQELQAEWRTLKARLDALLDESEGVSIYDARAGEIHFEVRMIRQQIKTLAETVEYAEDNLPREARSGYGI